MRYALKDAEGTLLRYQDFEEKPTNPVGKGWYWEEDPYIEPTPPPVLPRQIDKLTIINRLADLQKFTVFMQTLGGTKTLKYERWSATQSISVEDEEFLSDLVSIGIDPEVFLAE